MKFFLWVPVSVPSPAALNTDSILTNRCEPGTQGCTESFAVRVQETTAHVIVPTGVDRPGTTKRSIQRAVCIASATFQGHFGSRLPDWFVYLTGRRALRTRSSCRSQVCCRPQKGNTQFKSGELINHLIVSRALLVGCAAASVRSSASSTHRVERGAVEVAEASCHWF